MTIREQLGYELEESISKVDKHIDAILEGYWDIAKSLVKCQDTSSLSGFKIVVNNISGGEPYDGFVRWLKEEGYEFLLRTARYLYKDDIILVEELMYLKCIINATKNIVEKYPSEAIGVLVDISDQLTDLLKSARCTFELMLVV